LKDNSESKVIPLWPNTPDAPRILYLRFSSSRQATSVVAVAVASPIPFFRHRHPA
jgi:hypothetical protein